MRPHPLDREEKEQFAKESELLEKVSAQQHIDDVLLLMSKDWGRRIASKLLHDALLLPGQRISNTNGSLQSNQVGRQDAVKPLDEVIRSHCNEQWLLMLKEMGL